MMTSIDTLEIAKRLRDAGINEKQAEAITSALRDVLRAKQVSPDNADLSRLANKDDIAALRTEMAALRTELRAERATLRTELKSEIEILRRDLTIRLGGMSVVLGGFLAAIKFLG